MVWQSSRRSALVLILGASFSRCLDAFLVVGGPPIVTGSTFVVAPQERRSSSPRCLASKDTTTTTVNVNNVAEASSVLEEWDKNYNKDNFSGNSLPDDIEKLRGVLPKALNVLNEAARSEREKDSTLGRCMLGICASSVDEGIATLKSFVTELGLPRGLLHGADKDGVPLPIEGGVYIKYNTGGFLTFSQIRASGLGFDALWKPGDALLEPYDGSYRGVYFQVELSDQVFRQYLVPSDIFDKKLLEEA